MKTISWLSAGVALGAAGYYIYNNKRGLMSDRKLLFSTGNTDLDDAADRAATWGTKQRVSGEGRKVVGRAKQGLGRVVGDDDLAAEGVVDQVAGTAKNVAGTIAHGVSETIKDSNQ
jgi:uncharacterized protein YjbJ (UPF0337 family)